MNEINLSGVVSTNHGGEVATVRRRRAVYHEQIGVRLPPGVVAALDRASLNKRCSTSEYIRRLLLDGLDRDGVELPPPEPMT